MGRIFGKLFVIYGLVIIVCFLILEPLVVNPRSNHFTILFLGILIATALSVITLVLLLRLLSEIRNVTQHIARGDFDGKIPVKPASLFKDFAKNLNQLSLDLQQKMTKAAKDTNELNAIVSSMAEGVIVIGADEKIVLLSRPLLDMLDLRSKETIGRHYWEVIRTPEINSALKETLADKTARKKELEILFPSE